MVLFAAALALAADPLPCQGCTELERFEAGTGASGVPLTVLHVRAGSNEEAGCTVEQYWLLAPPRLPRTLLELCNDGYGASGVGEDTVSVGANRFEHGRYGGSAWRWSSGAAVQLDPLRVLSTDRSSFHSAGPDHESATRIDRVAWQWRTE